MTRTDLVSEVGRWLMRILRKPARASPPAVPPLLLRSAAVRSTSNMTHPSFSLRYANSSQIILLHIFIAL